MKRYLYSYYDSRAGQEWHGVIEAHDWSDARQELDHKAKGCASSLSPFDGDPDDVDPYRGYEPPAPSGSGSDPAATGHSAAHTPPSRGMYRPIQRVARAGMPLLRFRRQN